LAFDTPSNSTSQGGASGDLPQTPLIVRLTALGREITSITDWSISSSFMTSTDAFEFTVYDEDIEKTRGLELQPVELVVGDRTRLVGRIDGTKRGRNGYSVTCYGRDFIADMVESNVDPTLKIKPGDNVLRATLAAGGPNGIENVGADDGAMSMLRSGVRKKSRRNKGKDKRQSKLNDYKPQPGQGIYEFINKILAREAVTMQPGPVRNTVILATPNYDQDATYQFRRTRDQQQGVHNNIESAEANRDFSSFPTYVIVQGALARAGQKGEHATQVFDTWAISHEFKTELGKILQNTTISGRWVPSKPAADKVKAGALYRLLVFKDDDARNAEQIENAARRAIAERMKETLQYTVSLKGHTDPLSLALYTHDMIANVNDDIADVHEELWVESCTLKYSASEGSTTEMILWRPEGFEL
jgi:prophage tail gpP-like protein